MIEKSKKGYKVTWNTFRNLSISKINKMIEEHGRIIIVTMTGDIYEITEVQF